MDETGLTELAQWITAEGLAGSSEAEMMTGFCERAVAAGLPIASAVLFIDTLHPIHEGRAARWSRAAGKTEVTDYGRTNEGENAQNWRATPFYRLVETGEKASRHRVHDEAHTGSSFFRSRRDEGLTEYICV